MSSRIMTDELKDFDDMKAQLKGLNSEEFSSIKGSINELSSKMDSTQKEKEGMFGVSEFVDHLNTCDNNNCDLHKTQNTLNNNNYMKGFLLGAKFGKQKRS